MSSSNLIRLSGLAALGGGVLIVISDALNAALFPGEQGSGVMLTSTWFIVQILGLVAIALITLGLVGMYAHQAQKAGTLGLIAFVIAFSGMLMVFGLSWSEPFLGPLVAEAAPGLLNTEPSGALAVVVSLRTGALPRGAAIILIAGALLAFILSSLDLPLWSLVLGAAMAWMGYAQWSGNSEQAMAAEATR